jgi:uncharacterized protein (TIGR02265 family)
MAETIDRMSSMDGSVLEGLFVRELKPTGAFKAALERIGIHLERLEPRYSEETFKKAIELAAEHAYPGVSREEAHFKIGERVIAGYFATILGRVTGGLIPVIGVKRTLGRVSQLWTVPQPGMRISATETPSEWLVNFQNTAMTADLVAGIIQSALRRVDPGLTAKVLLRAPGSGQISVQPSR